LAENGGLAKSNISLLRVAEIVGPPWFFGSFRSSGLCHVSPERG